ncbi:MAG: aspartate aminotransferase family protein [Alphaproteobacteria bacterium]|nr:aspartate aminotransferase family protein [Alphaproteobacteria bacterium]
MASGGRPDTRVLHRHSHSRLPIAVAGDGPYVIDADGKRYLDASGGAAVSCLGHSDQDVIAAIHRQSAQMPFAHTAFFTNAPMETLADKMVAGAPEGLDRVYFTSGGSEAMEAALKMARQYFVEIGQPERSVFIARRQSYHGNTLGALSVGGNEWRRAPFREIMAESRHVTPCFAYREKDEGESDDDFAARLADELDTEIRAVGPERVIAFVAETVVGATSGAVEPVDGYFRRIREVCDRHGILLILDEIMCGLGRTGSLYAFEQDGVTPDLVTVAKGLAAGYQPIGAVLMSDRIFGAFYEGSGFFQHGHTFMGHATACAAALVVQEKLQAPETIQRVRELGRLLDTGLQERFGNHPHVGDIRGRGFFRGLELVADRTTKAAFEPSARLAARIKAEGMSRGLMCYPAGGTIDGVRGDHILLAPPFILTDEQVGQIVERLGDAVDAAITGVRGGT